MTPRQSEPTEGDWSVAVDSFTKTLPRTSSYIKVRGRARRDDVFVTTDTGQSDHHVGELGERFCLLLRQK